MFLLFLAASAASTDYAIPEKYEACIQAVENENLAAASACDVAPYSRVYIMGEGQNYRPACLEAMKAGPKWLEAKRKLPPPMAGAYAKKFTDARSRCLVEPSPTQQTPVRKTIQLWD